MAKENVTYGLTVSLDKTAAELIAAASGLKGQTAEILSSVSAGLLADLANGGAMIGPDDVSRLTTAMGEFNVRSLIDLVEQASKRREGMRIVEWHVDPTYEPMLEDMAEAQGVSVDRAVKDMLEYAIEQGWLGATGPQPSRILMNEDDLREVAEIIGTEQPTGTEIADWIRDQATLPVSKEG